MRYKFAKNNKHDAECSLVFFTNTAVLQGMCLKRLYGFYIADESHSDLGSDSKANRLWCIMYMSSSLFVIFMNRASSLAETRVVIVKHGRMYVKNCVECHFHRNCLLSPLPVNVTLYCLHTIYCHLLPNAA